MQLRTLLFYVFLKLIKSCKDICNGGTEPLRRMVLCKKIIVHYFFLLIIKKL